jgi:hypothetical protein
MSAVATRERSVGGAERGPAEPPAQRLFDPRDVSRLLRRDDPGGRMQQLRRRAQLSTLPAYT